MDLRRRGDGGQAVPLYTVSVIGLLLLAFALLVVARGADLRARSATAADAAALAAAHEARDQLGVGLLALIVAGDREGLGRAVNGLGPLLKEGRACAEAAEYAERNGARLVEGGCDRDGLTFTVTVEGEEQLGPNVAGAPEGTRARATASAEVRLACQLEPADPEPEPEPTGPGSDLPSLPLPVTFDCDGRSVTIDPGSGDGRGLGRLKDLFVVRLTD